MNPKNNTLKIVTVCIALMICTSVIVASASPQETQYFGYDSDPAGYTQVHSTLAHHPVENYGNSNFTAKFLVEQIYSKGISVSAIGFYDKEKNISFRLDFHEEEDGDANTPDRFRINTCEGYETNCTQQFYTSGHELWSGNNLNANLTFDYNKNTGNWTISLENINHSMPLNLNPSEIDSVFYARGDTYPYSEMVIKRNNSAMRIQETSSSSETVVHQLYIEGTLSTANVSGVVRNTSNNPVSNATVNITDSTGSQYTTLQTDSNGSYNTQLPEGNYTFNITKSGYIGTERNISVGSQDITANFTIEKKQEELVIEVQKWMYPNTTQPYKGIYLPSTGYTIVTSQLNVTSDNTSVIVVNESTNELIAQPNVNNTANVTFSYKYLEVTKEIAVSHRTLEYIHILPSSQWVSATLGIDDANTEYGMGSEIQWIFVAIILSSVLASIGNSEWIGLGSIIMVMTLLWILGNISLGMVLSTLFFGLFLALTLMDVPRSNTTEINVERNDFK